MLPFRARVDPVAMTMKGYIPQTSKTGASQSDCLMLYPGHISDRFDVVFVLFKTTLKSIFSEYHKCPE